MKLVAVFVFTVETVHVPLAGLRGLAGLVEALRVGTLVMVYDNAERLATFAVTEEMRRGACAIVQEAALAGCAAA